MTLAPQMFSASPALDIEGTHNFRSTGGYATRTSVTRHGSLFRSDALDQLTEAGVRSFAEQGIVRVIDLRHDVEVRQAPTAVPSEVAETIHHPIFEDGSLISSRGVPSFTDLYRYIATDRVSALVSAVRLIADAPMGGVLVHCTAGKDRTGLVVATALLAVGVEREQVIADYSASAQNLSGEWADRIMRDYTARYGVPVDDALRELVTASPAPAITEAIGVINEHYGSAEQMLLRHGFDHGALERLHLRLID